MLNILVWYFSLPTKSLSFTSLGSEIIKVLYFILWLLYVKLRTCVFYGGYKSYLLQSNYDLSIYPAGIYLLKVNNRNNRTRCEICSKLTIKIPERRQWCRSGVWSERGGVLYFMSISYIVETLSKPLLNFQNLLTSKFLKILWFISVFAKYISSWMLMHHLLSLHTLDVKDIRRKVDLSLVSVQSKNMFE